MAGISFAQQPLLLVDAYGKLADWIDRVQPLDDTMLFGSYPLATYNSALPVMNYSPRPRMRINTLYWPSGATRWACGLFLVAESQLSKIVEACQSFVYDAKYKQRTQTLVLDDGETKLEFDMYALRPRQLNCTDLNGEKLWLLPLVDVRWYWQYVMAGIGTIPEWEEVFRIVGQQLGVVPGSPSFDQFVPKVEVSAVDARYLIPDPAVFFDIENGAVLFDALALSIGMRVVRDFPPKIPGTQPVMARVMSFEDAFIRHTANTLDKSRLIAGDQNPRDVPADLSAAVTGSTLMSAAVPTTFTLMNANRYSSEFACPFDESYGQFFGRRLVRTTLSETGTMLKNLADVLGQDYYRSKRLSFDLTYAGLKRWQPSAYDDFILYEIGPRMPDGSLKVQTRVCSHPDNVEVDKQCSKIVGACSTKAGSATSLIDYWPFAFPRTLPEGEEFEWADPDNALLRDGNEASVEFTDANDGGLNGGICISGFGFAIPLTATIVSIQVRTVSRQGGAIGGNGNVALTLNAGADHGGKFQSKTWPNGDFVWSDPLQPATWGVTNGVGPSGAPTPTDINRPGFGVLVYVTLFNVNVRELPLKFYLDFVEVTVCYK